MPDILTETLYSKVLQDNGLRPPMFNIRKIRQAFFKGTERSAMVTPEDLFVDHSADDVYPGKKKLILKFLCQEDALTQCLSKDCSAGNFY